MRIIGITSTAVLSLLLGIAVPAYARQEQHGEKQEHGQQQGGHEQGGHEQQHAQPPPQQHSQQQQPQQQQHEHQQNAQEQRAQQQQRQNQNTQQQQQQRAQQQQRNNQQLWQTHQQQRVQQSAWQQHRSQNWQSDHRTWQQRGGYHGYRIPDDRYRGYFGPDHGFRISGLPFLVVGGYPRFQYDGYWISTVDPWPEYWGNDWYDTDDVYVNYVDNGYYLYNRRYPGPGIAINITL
jgi:hypothetical protein